MRMRVMTKSDIPAAMRLKEIAGWNQTAADWMRFLDAGEEGCFVAEVDGEVRGTVASIVYEKRFAWVGMVLVDPEYRGKGLGTRLLQIAMEFLQNAKIACIKLDATPQGKPIYEKLGFECEYEIERWVLKRAPQMTSQNDKISKDAISEQVFEAILAEDRAIFGADRSHLLRSLHQSAPEFTNTIFQGSAVRGYTFGRRGSFANHLGPWTAIDPDTASELMQAFIAGSRREILLVDCLKSNAIARGLVRSLGFEFSRPLTRMYLGANRHPGQTENLYAIAGPEFG